VVVVLALALLALAVFLVLRVTGFGGLLAANPSGTPVRSGIEGLAQFAPSGEAWIEAVDLGTNSLESFDPGQSATTFPSGTERVVVWYRWAGAELGRRIDNRWSYQGSVVLEQGEVLEHDTGTAAWFLVSEDGGPLPDGDYRVELVEDGRAVTTIPFSVGGG
jgi:hypothetical protein